MSNDPFQYGQMPANSGADASAQQNPEAAPSAPSAYSAPATAPYGTPMAQTYGQYGANQPAPASGAYVPPGGNQPGQGAPLPSQPPMPGSPNGYTPQGGVYAPAPKKDSFFGALFDLSFSKYITVKWAKVVYIISMVGIVIGWLGGAIFLGILGGLDAFDPGFSGGWFFAGLIFGLIPALLQLIGVRLLLEFAAATVRNEMNTRKLAENAASAEEAGTGESAA